MYYSGYGNEYIFFNIFNLNFQVFEGVQMLAHKHKILQ